MDVGNAKSKGIAFAVLGGLLIGANATLIFLLPFKAYFAFNLAIGLLLIWFGVLISSRK